MGCGGTGNVLIAGASMRGFDANLGYGEGDRSVEIGGLWYGLVNHPPLTLSDTAYVGGLTIANPYGQLDATLHDTGASMVNISTTSGADTFDIRGMHALNVVIDTYNGTDSFVFGASEYRGNDFSQLTLNTGRNSDSVWISDTDVMFQTDIDMGRDGAWGSQPVRISAVGDSEFHDLTIRGRRLDVAFGGAAGLTETLIHGELDIQTTDGRPSDSVVMRNVKVIGGTTINLNGGDDFVSIVASDFGAGPLGHDLMVDLAHGNDTFLMGQSSDTLLPGAATRIHRNAIIMMGRGSDQIGITNVQADGLLFANLGPSSGRGQRARIATVGGVVTAGSLGVSGTGKTNIYVGNEDTYDSETDTLVPSVVVAEYFSVSTGMDTSRDTVWMANVLVHGSSAISTGGGTDTVSIRWSQFSSMIVALGDGMDALYAEENHFIAPLEPDDLPGGLGDYPVEFYGGDMRDLMWIVDNTFDGDV